MHPIINLFYWSIVHANQALMGKSVVHYLLSNHDETAQVACEHCQQFSVTFYSVTPNRQYQTFPLTDISYQLYYVSSIISISQSFSYVVRWVKTR